jgi:hypothetical protein
MFLLPALACAVPARASWIDCMIQGGKDFCHGVARDIKRRNCWPQPFVCPDRQAIRSPLNIMVSNGWRRQNMLGDHHFEEDGKLTDAGRIKIRWILTEAPQHHRTIYVRRATTAEVTAARIDSVQQLAALIVPEGELPAVLETSIPAQGWPAARVDAIGRKFEATIPDPRLPDASGTGGESQ